MLRTQGIKATVLGSTVPDMRGPFSVTAALIAGTIGIPLRVLFGSERGQLASTQDERNFNARVLERQQHYAEPSILRPFVDKLIALGALKKEQYAGDGPDVHTLAKKETADVPARVAQRIRNIAAQTKDGQIVISSGEFREHFLGLPRKIEE